MLGLILCCCCLEIRNDFIFELVFDRGSLMGQWNMHVSSGNATRGYACLGAEGSGHAGNPACTHMRPSSSVQPGGGDGGGNSRSRGNSCGSAGPTDMKGPRVGTAPGPAWEASRPLPVTQTSPLQPDTGAATAGTQAADRISKLTPNT